MDSQESGSEISPEQAKARFRQVMEHNVVTDWVHDNPWTAVAIAVGVGLVIGRSRKLRSSISGAASWLVTNNIIPMVLAAVQGAQSQESAANQDGPETP